MPKSRITEFARTSRDVSRVQQAYGGYQRQAEVPLDERQQVPGDYEAIAGQGDIAESARWNLNHGDRGVVMMRRLITENIDALADGEDYKTIERARKIAGVLATYTRDSVMKITPRDDDETELRREFGSRISALVLDAADMEHDQARAFFTDELARFIEPWQ
ncbi:MAG: hypothetical protein GY875_14530 [Gammaproteobacteria bacterium]|nr:hypothetical protein [Gammaproteobacteria bacterium]